jgi:hypothetical protein
VLLDSISGVLPKTCLYVDRELMSVISLGVGKEVNVRRGVAGTGASKHSPATYVVTGRQDQFRSSDPLGSPSNEAPIQPWINVETGRIWLQEGDELGNNLHYWQEVSLSHVAGVLGFTGVSFTPSVP